MSTTDTQLLLRLSADVARFEKQMSRIMKSGETAAVTTERRFRQSNRRMAQNAEQSGQAIAREMDRLRAKYDPLFAASKRYEASLEELNRAHRVGALTSRQHEAALETLNAEYARSSGAATTAGRSFRGMGGGLQNVSYQIADFATQVGAGTSAAVALGQQAPQLLAGFGAIGAVLGAVAAVAIPLTSSLFGAADGAETLEERAQELATAVEEYRAAVEQASLPTAELAEKYGTATAAARRFHEALVEVNEVFALDNLEKQVQDIVTAFGSLERSRGRDPIGFQRLREDLGVVADRVPEVAAAIKELDEAEGPEQVARSAERLLSLLEETVGPIEEMNAQQLEMYENIRKTGLSAADLTGAAQQAAGAISGAASEAGRLADEIGRAVDNAISLAAQGISSLRESEIRLQYKGDPVATAGALARERMMEEQAPIRSETSNVGELAYLDLQVKKHVEAVEATERNRQALAAWRQEQSKASRSGGTRSGGLSSSGGGRSRSAREVEPFFQDSDDELQRIERRIEMIGKTEAEVARLQARYELLDEAKRRGLDLDARQAESGETLRQQIERQSKAVGDLTEKYEQAEERAKFFEDIQDELKDGLIDAIVEGENFAGVLENVAKMLAKAALQAALFGEGPLADLFGGSEGGLLGELATALGSAIGSAIGGSAPGRAAGGPVHAGRMYMTGEHGREPFIPAVNGRILSTAQAQKAISGAVAEPAAAKTPSIHIHENAGGERTQVKTDPVSGRTDIYLRNMIRSEIRGGGLDKDMRGRFGIAPKPPRGGR